MYYKISPILIGVLVVIVIAIAGIGITLVVNNKTEGETQKVQMSDIEPILELSANTDEENQESVTITATASTEDENGINSIILPDDSVVRADNAAYVVNKNGSYKFKVKGNNGKSSSLTFEVTNIREASASEPYIPEGFSHIGGEVDNGFVIQDKFGNQYVWVPVESGKLTRDTLLDTDYEETSSYASALVNSVAQNYGFYIGRYEASAGKVGGQLVATSIGDREPWVNVTYNQASEAAINASSIFEYKDCKTAIINSYAWDTTLAWINKNIENYSSNTSYGNYSGEIRKTGATESDIKNNICDMSGNVREWTTEIYKMKQEKTDSNKNTTNEVISETITYRVVRGGSANLNRTASSHTGYKENISDNSWGFRMVLYK